MIIGHKEIIKDLKKLADANELSHGYIFWGSAMIGKRTFAVSLARYLETKDFESTLILQDCVVVSPNESGTIGIDQVRRIKNFLWQKPAVSSLRTLIVDDADRMTTEAQNAILKVAEEPPVSSLLILITSDADALNPTISSRLQSIYFSPVPQKEIETWAGEIYGDKKSVTEAVLKSVGRPGLTHALLTDEDFAEAIENAEKLMGLSAEKRKDFLKKLMDRDGFNFAKLLDALILVSSWGFLKDKKSTLWHRLLQLRHDAAYFNLNPRLQIESLFTSFSHPRT